MTDAQIIRLYQKRDERAIAATAQKYGGYCTSIALCITGSREDAEECVNDAYRKTWDAIPPNEPTSLSAFLGKIVRNTAFNRYRYNTAEKRGGGQLPLVLDELSECVSDGTDLRQAQKMQELTDAVNGFLAALTPHLRRLFVCRYWYTESIAQIAKEKGMTEAAVTMALYRMRMGLKQYLTERGFLDEQ